jgi:VWFA-related protein
VRTPVLRSACGVANALLLLTGLAVGAEPQGPPSADEQARGPYRISVNADLVVLQVTVRDRQGQIVSTLEERNFGIYEDGVPQRIRVFQHEDVPVTAGLVVDHSGSMRLKLREVTTAARSFVQFSNPEDEMFVVNFNETVALGLPGTIRFTNDPAALAGAIWRTPATGQTALYDAVVEALQRLGNGSRDKKVLLVISDGGDNASAHSLAHVLKMAGQSSALIYTIGIFDKEHRDQNPNVLKRLATATGGEAFFPGQPNEVLAVCERIARDIRHQYTLGYVPTNAAQPGAYRAIRLVARTTRNVNLFVRTRAGYIAGGESLQVNEEGVK